MAINATIQVRRGLLKDFDPTKMLPGEWAVSIDASTSNQIVWMCFAPGVCKRMGTYEDFKSMISQANGEIIEELRGEFEAILADIESVAKDVSADKEEVLVVKSEILDTYIPQIQNYVNTASTHAKNAKTSEGNAKTSENNAKVSENSAAESAEQAQTYAEQALSTTPDGYNQMVEDVDLLKNAIIQTADRTLYGSKAGGIKLIGIGGASEQKQYSGKNLYNNTLVSRTAYGITFTMNEDGSVTMSGTATEQAYVDLYSSSTALMDGISPNVDYIYSLGNSHESVAPVSFSRVNDKWVGEGITSSASWGLESNTLNIGSDATGMIIRLQVKSGATLSNHTVYPMISVDGGEYEPYVGATASPNPIYPQEIESVGDLKNLLPPREGVTSNGITYSVDDRGVVTANGATTASADSYEFAYFSNKTALPDWLETGVEYIASCNSSNSKLLLQCYYYNEDGSAIGVVDTSTSASFTIPETAVGLILRLYVSRNVTLTNTKAYPMIRKASVQNAEYKPYGYSLGIKASNEDGTISKSITIPLNEPLRKGDKIAVVDGVWGIDRRAKVRVIDGTNVVKNDGTDNSNYLYYLRTSDSSMDGVKKLTTVGFCESLSHRAVNELYTLGNDGFNTDQSENTIYINLSSYVVENTISAMKAYLAENPIPIQYELATPTFEPFTDQTPFYGLESFDTVTYISTDSEVEPTVILKFAKTEGDAVTLLNYNQTNLNRIAIAELTSAVLALNQE